MEGAIYTYPHTHLVVKTPSSNLECTPSRLSEIVRVGKGEECHNIASTATQSHAAPVAAHSRRCAQRRCRAPPDYAARLKHVKILKILKILKTLKIRRLHLLCPRRTYPRTYNTRMQNLTCIFVSYLRYYGMYPFICLR